MRRGDSIKKAVENGKFAEAIREFAATEEELHALLDDIIEHREHLRDEEIKRLEREAAAILRRLEENRHAKLVAEISCFKDVLKLHQARLSHDGR